jgi:hypothetical protein
MATLGMGLSLAAWLSAVPATSPPGIGISLAPPDGIGLQSQRENEPAGDLYLRNPFRTKRAPTQVRFGSEPIDIVDAGADAVAPVRPDLRLGGIVGGPPWSVLVEGVPGREGGLLLAEGQTVDGVVFRALRGDTLVLAAFDTIWRLTPRSNWH